MFQYNHSLLNECSGKAVEWTKDLVRLNSENPPGHEIECARFCEKTLSFIGFEVKVDEFEPGRANVIALLGNRENTAIAFNGHLDVVPATDGWTYPPFDAYADSERIWGRGSADMKSGCACVMAAARYCVKSGMDFSKRGMIVAFVADEENVNKGSIELSKTDRLCANACVIAEPTDLNINYGNRGYMSFYIRTRGKAAHSCDPFKGVNAIYKMAKVLEKLEMFAFKLRERKNDQLGCVTLNVGRINGGVSTNSVPAECQIEVECRVFPGMDAETMRKELQVVVGDDAEVIVRSNLLASLVPVDSEIVRTAAAIEREIFGREPVIKEFSACSEASFYSVGYGMPTILLGPGDIGVAHKTDEFVPIKDIGNAVKIYIQLINHYCGHE